jgi:dihydrofolate reductase
MNVRKIIVSTYATLDGIFNDPQNWSFDYMDEAALEFAVNQLFAADALLLGRETYQSFAEAWPDRTDEAGFADRINSMQKYVVSTTLTEPLPWGPATLIKSNVAEEVAKLKQQPGQDILIYGTGRLTDTLLQHGLIDEHRTWVIPVIWGKGQRIFDGFETAKLELVEAKALPSGTVILSHKQAQG